MKIDWKRKLSSRKFWAFLGGFVTSLLIVFNADEDTIVKITALVTSFGSMAIYVLSEAIVDKSAIGSNSDGEQ